MIIGIYNHSWPEKNDRKKKSEKRPKKIQKRCKKNTKTTKKSPKKHKNVLNVKQVEPQYADNPR